MKFSLVIFGIILTAQVRYPIANFKFKLHEINLQSIYSAPVDIDVDVDEQINPQMRGFLDSILAALVSGITSTAQGAISSGSLISSSISDAANTGGNLLGSAALGAINSIIPLTNTRPATNQRDEELVDIINALVDQINVEGHTSGHVGTIGNGPILSHDGNIDNLEEIPDNVEEIPMYLILL